MSSWPCTPEGRLPTRTRGRRLLLLSAGATLAPARLDMVRTMYWPLIGGFVAFLLLLLLMGWIMDTSGRDERDRRG